MKPAKKGTKSARHDWEFFKILYVSGVDVSEICKMEEFQETKLSPEYAHVHVARSGWKEERDKVRDAVTSNSIEGIKERIKLVRERFNEIVLGEIEKEMNSVQAMLRIATPAAMAQRLDNLKKLREVASPVLGLDLQESDPNVAGFKAIYNIQVNGNLVNQQPTQQQAVDPLQAAIDIVADAMPSEVPSEKKETALQRIRKISTPVYRNDNSSPIESTLLALQEGAQKRENESKIIRNPKSGSRKLGLPIPKEKSDSPE